MNIEQLTTPCAVIDRHRLEANLDRMVNRAVEQDVRLRPHVKTHKSVALAELQQEKGAEGVTVATVGEAEEFAGAGFSDIRLAYSLVGIPKHQRLLSLCETARISFCVDTEYGARQASDFYAENGEQVDVLVEIDCGHGRCGVPWDDDQVLSLTRLIHELPGLQWIGLLTHAGQAYDGPQEHESRPEALRRVGDDERNRMLDVASRLHDAGGIPTDRTDQFEISIGSTPSLSHFSNEERGGFRVTEIRPGNYVFHDAMQVALGAAELDDCALTVLSTVTSSRREGSVDRVVLDAGKKILSTDQGYGTQGFGRLLYNPKMMRVLPHAYIHRLSEEHGWVRVTGGSTVHVGDQVRIVPNHACMVAPGQEKFYVLEGETVVDSWSIDA